VIAGGLAFQASSEQVPRAGLAPVLAGTPAEVIRQIEQEMEIRPDEPADRADGSHRP
jgi:alkanesulfonate monooxygenase SsuD/methylene tetrahydromethanopterin reductase-like flavin-dependent oxidoreductase (luciferase family)